MSLSVKKNKSNLLEFYFVHKDDGNPTTSSEDMQIAFRACTEHFGSNRTVKWISENDCEKFNVEHITNKNIFVFSEFSGTVFTHLETSTTAVILGPRCLISCFNENVEIPTSNSPVYTLPMRKLSMTASGLTVQEKEAIKWKVSYMGGLYLDDLNDICTHLVTKTIGSVKYEIAASKNMCIMHPDWVPEVWKQSQTRYILATDIEFHKFKLPCFHSLNITSTGLTGSTLESIKSLVNKNGGTYSGVFTSENTDILLLEQRSVTSKKFQAAVRFKKLCLSPQWIFDSIDKGYSLPYSSYTISSLKVSTPTKSGVVHSYDFNPDSTALSEISYLEDKPISLSETMVNTSTRLSSNESLNPNNEKSYKQAFKEIDMVHTRKSGSFLDGCNIFLSGFTNDEKDKLNNILNMGGATRFEELNEKVTHVLIGDIIQADFKFLEENKLLPYIIKMSWLLESIKLKQPACEDAHKISDKKNSCNVKTVAPNNPSPATKKTIQSMNYSFKRPAIPKFRLEEKLNGNSFENIESEDKNISKLLPPLKHEDDLVSQYLEGNKKNELTLKPLQPTTATTNEHTTFDTCEYSEDYTIKNFLEGCHCYIYGFSDVYCEQMIQDCEKAGAIVVGDAYKDEVDFIITPSERIEIIDAPVTARNIVNDLWLDESIRLNERANASHYYFRPIVFEGNEQPLLNEAVVVSIYSSGERSYLVNLAQSLGANVNDKYIKAAQPILICPKPEGAKYEGAIKWGNAVLTAEWLCNCLKEKRRINEIPYLVGDSIPSKKNKVDEIINEESSDLNRKSTAENNAKENEPNVVEKVLDEDNFLNRPKRVRELAAEKSSPKTPTASLSISDVVKLVPTPHRALLYDTLKTMEETPNTKRFRKLIATPQGKNGEIPNTKTPEMPECLRTEVTPYGFRPDASPRNHEMHKRCFQVLDTYYQPISDSKRRKSITPLSEVKRRFWKNAFGDEYDSSPSIDNDEKPSTSTQSRKENNLDVANSISRMNNLNDSDLDENSASKSGSNENVKRLSDFISKSREETSKNIKLERARHISEDHKAEEKTNLVRIDTQLLDLDTEQNNKDVDWRDPDDFFQSQRFQIKSQTKKIVLCSISNITPDSRRDDIITKIIQLGGEVLDQVYDDKTTHIFCDKLNRGEKILSAIASGKWILSSKYIEDSAASQEFLNEELYQWGNPNAKSLPELGAMDNSIAKASFNWRRKILTNTEKIKGAFTGFRIILHHTNKSSFHRLLEVGDGQVIDAREPYRNSEAAKTATHCIVEARKLTLSSEDHKALKKAGVMVLNVTFLNAYLTQENLPDPKDFMLPI